MEEEIRELKKVVAESLELAKENNIILKKLRHGQRVSIIMRIVYWVVILAIAFGSYIFVGPYLKSLLSFYTGLGQGKDINSLFPETGRLQNVFDQLKDTN